MDLVYLPGLQGANTRVNGKMTGDMVSALNFIYLVALLTLSQEKEKILGPIRRRSTPHPFSNVHLLTFF